MGPGCWKQKQGSRRVWQGAGPPRGSCTSRDRRHRGTHGLWQQQATSPFMGDIEGGGSACARLWGTGIFNILGA